MDLRIYIHLYMYTCEKQTLVCLDSKQVEWPRPIWSVLRVGSLEAETRSPRGMIGNSPDDQECTYTCTLVAFKVTHAWGMYTTEGALVGHAVGRWPVGRD